jgi:hypothetical protein
MTRFLRLLEAIDKATALAEACLRLRCDDEDARCFQVDPEEFRQVPGAPFAYWVSDGVRGLFQKLPGFESADRTARQGLATADDFRFVRLWWEVVADSGRWFGFAKGGSFSPFYADVYLMVNWDNAGDEIRNFGPAYIRNEDYYLRPGLTWPRRTTSGLSMRIMPADCIFADKGPAAFVENEDLEELLAFLALTNAAPFQSVVELQLAAADAAARSYEVGVIQRTPVPDLTPLQRSQLSTLARRAWSLKRTLDTVTETSHAFILPAALRGRLGEFVPTTIEAEIDRIKAKIDAIAFDLYGFNDADRAAITKANSTADNAEVAEDDEDAGNAASADDQQALLSWCVGIAFGRFDWRLATGEREPPPEPEPFDPLPAKSPGMLPDDAEPFHPHPGILVDDTGHPHDLPHLIESVLERVDVPVPPSVRRWLPPVSAYLSPLLFPEDENRGRR